MSFLKNEYFNITSLVFYRGSSLHSFSSKSFRDFIVEEKKSITGHSAGDHVKKVCFKGIENPQAPKVTR